MMKIRKFLSKDSGQALEISRASFAEPWPQNEFEKYAEGSFVAEDKDKIAGFVIGKISGDQGTLKLVAVNPAYRGKGVGKKLMDRIFKYFTKNGAREIIARSRLHNEAGCSFLKSFGFEIVKTIKNYYLNGEDAYLMVKKLDD
ncbi:MAG: GNAT family N-acetyltransferase [Candidatus Nealsonbacteria bacterium]|nr:GNAT family N-acetyltransferase [Candidatus Nealsonbacteria bacterium]